jgi:phosphonopyruvate decarboxylase
MKMGSLGTIGHYRPRNLLHIILDNEAHESTGAQATVSTTVDFAAVAAACSYESLFRCDTPPDLERTLREALDRTGPVLMHVKVGVEPGGSSVGRPTLSPVEVKEQFMRHAAEVEV